MGGASSTLGSPGSASERAKIGKQLPDEILKLFFSNADYKDILSLSSIDKCPSYMFTTASAFTSLFQRLQVEPSLGTKGEILFAPITALSPGLIPEKKESDQSILKRKQERDVMCMEVSYFYVRIFQIYAALALSVMEADPVRRASLSKQQPRGPSRAIFTGGDGNIATRGFTGGASMNASATRGFTGGAVQASGSFAEFTKKLKGSVFAPLAEYFRWATFKNTLLLVFDDPDTTTNSLATFGLEWKTLLAGENKLVGYYIPKKGEKYFTEEVIIEPSTDKIELKFVSDRGHSIFEFVNDKIAGWVPSAGKDQGKRDASEYIHSYFRDRLEKEQQAPGSSTAPGSSSLGSSAVSRSGYSSSGLISAPSGKSSFESFESVKEVFDKRFKGDADFPKAYCIARAMTLLMPIFSSEKLNKNQPFYSQICKRTYDFESVDHMPRPGKRPNANIYLKSLVSLFYDDYRFSDGKVLFTQTETGRSDLQRASKQLASLYNITSNPETFIESTSEFKEFSICERKDVLLQINNSKLRDALLTKCVNPMIAFQEEHTKAVNNLLKEMFEVKGGQLRFTPALRSNGRAGVNAFGKRAAKLLLNYYIRSEAYFIDGVLLFENKENQQYFTRVV